MRQKQVVFVSTYLAVVEKENISQTYLSYFNRQNVFRKRKLSNVVDMNKVNHFLIRGLKRK